VNSRKNANQHQQTNPRTPPNRSKAKQANKRATNQTNSRLNTHGLRFTFQSAPAFSALWPKLAVFLAPLMAVNRAGNSKYQKPYTETMFSGLEAPLSGHRLTQPENKK